MFSSADPWVLEEDMLRGPWAVESWKVPDPLWGGEEVLACVGALCQAIQVSWLLYLAMEGGEGVWFQFIIEMGRAWNLPLASFLGAQFGVSRGSVFVQPSPPSVSGAFSLP